MKATAVANSNIAFVKYWGKKNTELNIPMNLSISMTLDGLVSTKTTVEFLESYKEDEFFLNDEKQIGEKLTRVISFLDLVRTISKINMKAKVFSINTFPTSAGIASSASGFAALAAAASKAAGLNLSEKELSSLARRGSGSASRSVLGGFVEWQGEYASQIEDENYWPELRDIIVILNQEEKIVSSREAMKLTVEKSKIYKKRLTEIPKTIDLVKKAISKKDFQLLAAEIMKDSEDMHFCINEIGIDYLNEDSYKIKEIISKLNKTEIIAAYSFDAGPNVHIITLDKNKEFVLDALQTIKSTNIISKPGKGIYFENKGLF